VRHVGALCCAIATIGGCTSTHHGSDAGTAVVTHVVDGDTIDVRIGERDERVRLIGIDTPETMKPNSPIECFGPEASAFTAALLPIGTRVRIERDLVGRDDYGRLLGYVHLLQTDDTDGSDDTFVNMEIIRQGYATALTIEPNSTYARDFARAAGDAEAHGLGLWTACSH
jgi:micrococcal nuclease